VQDKILYNISNKTSEIVATFSSPVSERRGGNKFNSHPRRAASVRTVCATIEVRMFCILGCNPKCEATIYIIVMLALGLYASRTYLSQTVYLGLFIMWCWVGYLNPRRAKVQEAGAGCRITYKVFDLPLNIIGVMNWARHASLVGQMTNAPVI
jgi:hypothetical protein